MFMPVIPDTLEAVMEGAPSSLPWANSGDPIGKMNLSKKGLSVERLPNQCKALSSNPSTTKGKKKKHELILLRETRF
jgi:hypothetical protein